MSAKIEMVGKRFGRLLVIAEDERVYRNGKHYFCKCDCGIITNSIRSVNLRNGITKSCGCLQKEIVSSRGKTYPPTPIITHHMACTRLYRIWSAMKSRCYNANSTNYHNYGARGITVCDEWLYDFKAFYDWSMSHGYDDNLSIDRIDVNGNYTPNNCRWATIREQNLNKRPRAKKEVG